MSVAAMESAAGLPLGKADVAKARELSPRTRVLLQGPIVPTLLRMAWPNVLVMFAQAASGLIETWFVAKLGTDALAGKVTEPAWRTKRAGTSSPPRTG